MKPTKSKHGKSKRLGLSLKYKVQKKVREAHRKQRKIEKALGSRGKLKKDPGLPNLHPFKQQFLLKEQEAKEREEEARIKRKQEAKEKKKMGLAGLVAQAEQQQSEFNEAQAMENDDGIDGTMTDSSRRAFYKEFRKVVEAADVILEVLDARDPMGCRCRRVEQQILAAGSDKRLVLVLNKIDLVPKSVLEKWMKYLRNEFPVIAFKASTQEKTAKISQSKSAAIGGRGVGASVCFGAPTLLALLGNYCRNLDIKTAIRVGVVGYPNVGKSSLINSLKRGKVCGVGAQPGFTTTCQEIVLDKHVKLIDSPGIVFAEKGATAEFALRNCIKIEDIEDPVTPVGAILSKCNHDLICEKYCVPEFETTEEFLQMLCRKLGKIKKGGVPDINAAARSILQDWNCGKISYYTTPPEVHEMPAHVGASFATEWGKDFDLDKIEGSALVGVESTCGVESSTDFVVQSSRIPADVNESDLDDEEMAVADGNDDNDDDEDQDDDMQDADQHEDIGQAPYSFDDALK